MAMDAIEVNNKYTRDFEMITNEYKHVIDG